MKRSNRLVLLIGIFLALLAFVLIIVLLGGGRGEDGVGAGPSPTPSMVKVVVAAKDIGLGARIQGTDVTLKEMAITAKPANAYEDTSLVIGQIARAKVTAGQLVTTVILSSGGKVQDIEVPAGFVGMSIHVDQVSGVGTVIKPGDFVDIVSGFTGPEQMPLVQPEIISKEGDPVVIGYVKVEDGLYNHSSVKVLAQGVQVLGTLLPPPPQQQQQQQQQGNEPAPSQPPSGSTTTLNGQEEIVIVAVPTQVAEIIKFSQMDGTISLVLRSPEDCTTEPVDGVTYCPAIATTGITLRRAIDDWGVLPPQVVQVIQPTPLPGTVPERTPRP